MKINEILIEELTIRHKITRKDSPEPVTKNASFADRRQSHHNTVKGLQSKLNTSDNKRILGSGVEAVVFQSNSATRQGIVTKWMRNQKEPASTNGLIQFLTKSQEYNSTLIPKVYSVTEFKRPNGMYEFSIQMEKLHKTLEGYCIQISDDELLVDQLLRQIVSEPLIDSLKNIARKPDKQISSHYLSTYIARLMREYYLDVGEYYIDLLPSVMEDIEYIGEYAPSNLDIHDENIMIRLTSVGPQIVITDPIADLS